LRAAVFAGSRPALDTGRWWNLVDNLAQNEVPTAWEFESPPAHQVCSRGGIGRRGSLKTSVNLQVRLLPGVPRTRPDGDGSSLQNCDSGFNSSRVCHVGDAEVVEAAVRKTALTGFESRLSLQSEGAKRRQRFLVPKTSALGKTRMGVRLLRPPPLLSSHIKHLGSHIKHLAFYNRFT
jgi:hypothetical protein